MAFELRKYTHPDFTEEKFVNAPNATLVEAPRDGIAPDNFHALSIFPEYFKIDGKWLMVEESRMDTVPMFDGEKVQAVEARRLKAGDRVICGRTENCEEGIFMHANGFDEKSETGDTFAFRTGRSRETAFSKDVDEIVELLKHEKEHGNVVWVLGPACSFDVEARRVMGELIAQGYCQALLAGNALATHDLEGGYLGTALGCDIENQKLHFMGHYNHLDTINAINTYGSIPAFIEGEGMLLQLAARGICVSSGSACHRGKPSHVFATMGLPKRILTGMLRISFSPDNTHEVVDALYEGLNAITKERISAR